LKKLSISECSSSAPASVKDALDQLQSTIDLVGADKREVYSWVLALIGMVRKYQYLWAVFKFLPCEWFHKLSIMSPGRPCE